MRMIRVIRVLELCAHSRNAREVHRGGVIQLFVLLSSRAEPLERASDSSGARCVRT